MNRKRGWLPAVSGGALMLEGEHEEGVEYPFGANVASLLIFDLDDEHTVGFVETLMPLELWSRRTTISRHPRAPAG
jgi:hypothetical protein